MYIGDSEHYVADRKDFTATPRFDPHQVKAVSLEITSLSLQPASVKVGEPFAIDVDYRVSASEQWTARDIYFSFRIYAGDKQLFSSKKSNYSGVKN